MDLLLCRLIGWSAPRPTTTPHRSSTSMRSTRSSGGPSTRVSTRAGPGTPRPGPTSSSCVPARVRALAEPAHQLAPLDRGPRARRSRWEGRAAAAPRSGHRGGRRPRPGRSGDLAGGADGSQRQHRDRRPVFESLAAAVESQAVQSPVGTARPRAYIAHPQIRPTSYAQLDAVTGDVRHHRALHRRQGPDLRRGLPGGLHPSPPRRSRTSTITGSSTSIRPSASTATPASRCCPWTPSSRRTRSRTGQEKFTEINAQYYGPEVDAPRRTVAQ
jgi:hypothetical protein